MGFLDGLGSFLGKTFVQLQEIQSYKESYETMSDTELIQEYHALKKKYGPEYKYSRLAIQIELQNRGIDISNQRNRANRGEF